MRYFATSLSDKVIPYYMDGTLGLVNTPQSRYRLDWVQPQAWTADNGCFGGGWNPEMWLGFLEKNQKHLQTCWWATVPDVVADHNATLKLFQSYAQTVRDLGYPLAFVSQNGATVENTPWDDFDCWFAGGTTEWKLRESWPLFQEAKRRGKKTHMGRVNSLRRFRVARDAGYDSVDGTFLAFGIDANLPQLLSWLRDGQGFLF